jgi:flagellar biosynthesis protein FliQ
MSVDQSVELTRAALTMVLLLGAPIMLMAVIVGLTISVLQAVTQLQDQTLSFVPKIVAMAVTGLFVLPWMLYQLVEYATNLFGNIPSLM